MDKFKYDFDQLNAEINSLPQGGITYKTINGKKYAYYQWRENGKQRSRRAKDYEIDILNQQIEKRKELENLLREEQFVYTVSKTEDNHQFNCHIRMGQDLERFSERVLDWEKRECYSGLYDYIYGPVNDRVFILYGLRRTGKTTMIRQVIADMTDEMKGKTAFMQVQEHQSLDEVNEDLQYLESKGYKYIFIDEVTLMEDFIEGAALFSDIFASSGMKIVLSGTDSLGFVFTEDQELYDRCISCHTTFIPYREFEQVLGIKGIYEYIRYGGTMSVGSEKYNDDKMVFLNKKKTGEYVNSAIARNIQNSLKNYQYGEHFKSLKGLYEKDQLITSITRIIEGINHRFTRDVLSSNFNPNDFRKSEINLKKEGEKPADILDSIDMEKVNEILKQLLDLKDKNESFIDIKDSHISEIKEYLDLLDITYDIETRWMSDYNKTTYQTTVSQPGIRYSQVEDLIRTLMENEIFRGLTYLERKTVTEKILDETKEKMMEDIILLESAVAKPNCEIFKLQFPVGGFDMISFDPEKGGCQIYEINNSKEVAKEQFRYLVDEYKCQETEHRYGKIEGKYVLYRGANTAVTVKVGEKEETIKYVNVEDYLNFK